MAIVFIFIRELEIVVLLSLYVFLRELLEFMCVVLLALVVFIRASPM
jgi:hypothetical protein